jgi:thiol-disulfide isomerase/thioredoxin
LVIESRPTEITQLRNYSITKFFVMKVDKGTVRAPEIGRIWFNSPPLSMHQLRGRVVLVDFWDYTCVNCIRTLPYIKEWHARYRDHGLTVIGVHTPEFVFARYESNVGRGIEEFGLTYPIVVDSNNELWEAFSNRYWPTKYLIDGEGYLRYAHFAKALTRRPNRRFRNSCAKSILPLCCRPSWSRCAIPTVPAQSATVPAASCTSATAADASATPKDSAKTNQANTLTLEN